MADDKNVLVVHFPESSRAFEALSAIKTEPGLIGAAVVERTAAGEIRIADGYAPHVGRGTAVGGLVGAVIGILAGPLGVLLGWSAGMLAGTAHDTSEAADLNDGFTVLSQSIPPGGNALIIEMNESSHAPADDIMTKLDGTVTRIPAPEVEAEVAAAHEAARRAAAEARRARVESVRSGFKDRLSGLIHHTKSS